MSSTLLESIEIETGPHPSHAVIWLHGLGADGNDFAPLVPELKLQDAPAIRFVFPHAPVRPVTINNGMSMRAWYDIFMPQGVLREDDAGLRDSQAAIEALISRENARGVPTENIVLAGFSQGCAMTLQTGLRLKQKLAGMMCLSGYLPLASLIDAELHPANQQTPIFLAHGTMDPVIVLERAQASQQKLIALGYDVSWKTYPMQHSVCFDEVQDISTFLRKVLV
ncbi:carboxylesterase [Candidimonas sp. SYP-B2681]|uniref:alpha/beta hydrolase n=1 Tax=Candidimonas sp. SYP-B2681 TaxID=2497686 RepID=UPI000F87E6B8|nr:dienelactone hydrolase family protein [Candidimonas sp. SYP-B2681]RTZ39932.1 carboxylesterase [Candidimonas sp. SYP-B2681]